MNTVQLIGRLTRNPETSTTPSGLTVCRFKLAVDRQKGEADFITCVCFDKQAENLARFQKQGDKVAVIGRIQTGSYEKQDGTKVYTTEVIANRIEFLNSKRTDNEEHFEGYEGIEANIPF